MIKKTYLLLGVCAISQLIAAGPHYGPILADALGVAPSIVVNPLVPASDELGMATQKPSGTPVAGKIIYTKDDSVVLPLEKPLAPVIKPDDSAVKPFVPVVTSDELGVVRPTPTEDLGSAKTVVPDAPKPTEKPVQPQKPTEVAKSDTNDNDGGVVHEVLEFIWNPISTIQYWGSAFANEVKNAKPIGHKDQEALDFIWNPISTSKHWFFASLHKCKRKK